MCTPRCHYLRYITLLPPANEVWGKVIFSQACVRNSVHGGCAIPACIAGGIPACLTVGLGGCYPSIHCRWYPSMPCSKSRGEGVPAPGGLLRGMSGGDPPGTATAAGGTHPTGMYSCLVMFEPCKADSITCFVMLFTPYLLCFILKSKISILNMLRLLLAALESVYFYLCCMVILNLHIKVIDIQTLFLLFLVLLYLCW